MTGARFGDTPLTILVVEDEAPVSNILAELLRESGWNVLTAANGAEALQVLRQCADLPAGILLDLNMPVMDGWQFRAAQKSDPRLACIPVILLSAQMDIESAAGKLGAVDWLNKPVPLKSLLRAVDALRHPPGQK